MVTANNNANGAEVIHDGLRQRICDANKPSPKPESGPSAAVLPFPIKRQRKLVDYVLRLAAKRPIEERATVLHCHASQYHQKLLKIGVDEERAELERRAFMDELGIPQRGVL